MGSKKEYNWFTDKCSQPLFVQSGRRSLMRLQKRIAAALLAAALMTMMLTACSNDGSHVTGGGNSGGSTGGNSPGISSGSEGGSKGDESGTVPEPEENPVYRIEKYNARHQSKTYTHKETVIEDTGEQSLPWAEPLLRCLMESVWPNTISPSNSRIVRSWIRKQTWSIGIWIL